MLKLRNEFHFPKSAISIDAVNINKMISEEFSRAKKGSKYYAG